MMFAEMQDAAVARDLGVERRIVAEAVFPLNLEAQKSDIEFVRLGDVEDAQDGSDSAECRHDGRPLM